MAATKCDKYRSFIHGEGEVNTVWKNGVPNYDAANELFEQGRTKVWEEGTVEERVQRLVKSWEMERIHKVRPQDYKTMNPQVFTNSVNGKPGKGIEELRPIGGYNNFLQTSLPKNLRAYDPSEYTAEEATTAFTTTFTRGFVIEVLEVYSGVPPKIAYKFRHWAFMEGPFQGHAPTGELVEFFGIGIFTVDESMIIQAVEFFYDPNELIAQLLKGPLIEDGSEATASTNATGLPILKQGLNLKEIQIETTS